MGRLFKVLGAMFIAGALAACGGGGGSPGTTGSGTGSTGSTTGSTSTTGVNTSTSGGTQSSSEGQIALAVHNSANVDATQIGATEVAHAVATVTDPSGNPVSGVIVVFSQANASLLTFAPAAGTALTDSNGQASIDFKATDPTQSGAVNVVAQVAIGSSQLTAQKGVQITGSAAATAVPASMLFLDASPTSIVIKGAGGQGRSESSTLRFKVVDANNSPIQGAVVNFSISTSSVTLNIAQSTSDADGVVVTTVTSGTLPTSVVVTATAAANAAATVPSSTLSVANGLTVSGGLEIVAEKYNLDGGVTGTTTTISAFLRDSSGNLVPDGTVVSFTTDHGAVGTSSAGSCSSTNGTCTVPFRVQEPRGNGLATVRATVLLPGNATPLATSLTINMADSASARALSALPSTVATGIQLSGTCKDTVNLYAADINNRALAAGTTISAQAAGKGVTVSIPSNSGSPVQDSLGGSFAPTLFSVTVDASNAGPACDPAATTTQSTTFQLQFTSPGGVTSTVPMVVQYPG